MLSDKVNCFCLIIRSLSLSCLTQVRDLSEQEKMREETNKDKKQEVVENDFMAQFQAEKVAATKHEQLRRQKRKMAFNSTYAQSHMSEEHKQQIRQEAALEKGRVQNEVSSVLPIFPCPMHAPSLPATDAT